MYVTLLKAKIHQARVTEVALEYEGSLTIDSHLMESAGIRPYEKILVANMENGERFETYAIEGTPGSRVIGLNGATAHKGSVGDRLIIFTFCAVSEQEAAGHQPRILVLDADNKPKRQAEP
ncbi:MAG: aspartate 1-decarboxylase [Kiritimatiellae bacterium]|nr:aspartate 1-decarboxylase [Kiritimatiellia bacterium]